jgi:hypothetical protein
LPPGATRTSGPASATWVGEGRFAAIELLACHTWGVSESETLTVYLQAEGDVNTIADQLRTAAAELPGVDAADVDVEDVERSTVEVLQSITLTLTAAGGVVGATNLLLSDLTKLIKTVKGIRTAWRDTEDGPVPIEVTDADTLDPNVTDPE